MRRSSSEHFEDHLKGCDSKGGPVYTTLHSDKHRHVSNDGVVTTVGDLSRLAITPFGALNETLRATSERETTLSQYSRRAISNETVYDNG